MTAESSPEELFELLVANAPRVQRLRGRMTRRAAYQVGTSGEIALAELEYVWLNADESEPHLTVLSNYSARPGYVPPDGKRGNVRREIKTRADVYAAIGRAPQ
jgi:hypothetical protein